MTEKKEPPTPKRTTKRTVNFTKARIAAEPVPTSGPPAALYDSGEPGLRLLTYGSGKKVFQLYRKFEGRPVKCAIGTWPDISVDQARKSAREMKVRMASGENPNDTLRQARQEMTFADLFAIYMARHAKPAKRTWPEDQRIFDAYLALPIGGRKLSEITRAKIAEIHAKRGQEAPTQANRVLALLSSVFGRAIEWGLWEKANPCAGIRHFSETVRDRFLSGDELRRLFLALDEEANGTARDFFRVALLTGARSGNLLEMKWVDIDLDAAIWRIPHTKNGTPQTVTLVPAVVDILKARREQGRKEKVVSPYVFPGGGRNGHMGEPKSAWRRICARAGIENARIHDLRRTFGSWQAITGASLPIIGKSLNHKNQSTTAIYARLDLDPVRVSVERAANAMLANIDAPPVVQPLRRAGGE